MKFFYNTPKFGIIVIDMLNAYFDKGGVLEPQRDLLINNINDLVDMAHNSDIPVFWVRQEYLTDLSDAPLANKKTRKLPSTIKGDRSSQILEELNRKSEDYEVIKKRHSAFFGTTLKDTLENLGINTLIIAGINSMTCVRYTVNDAYQMDYEVILALDCIQGYDLEQHLASMKYMQYSQSTGLTNSEILSELQQIRE